MNTSGGPILLATFILLLVLRKAGAGSVSLLLNVNVILLVFFLYKYKINERRIGLSYIFFLVLCLLFLQLWIPVYPFGIPSLILWILVLAFRFRRIFQSIFLILVSAVLSVVLITTVIFNERTFYNFYRSSYYESYIRSKYTERLSPVADLYIDKNKKIDKARSALILEKAKVADSLNQLENALRLYNECIDLNPDDPVAYHLRGYFKLTKLELEKDNAYSAVKDFDRAIRLDPQFTLAYYHRSLATGYLDLFARSYLDSKVVWDKDSMLTDSAFEKKYGTSKASFSKKANP